MRAILIPALFLASCLVAPAVILRVSPAGSDAAPGTNAKPLATLTGTRNALRRLQQAAPLTEAVAVHAAAETYFVDQIEPVRRERRAAFPAPDQRRTR